MIDHTSRLTGVVKGALKEAAMGEPVGYFVGFGTWPQLDPQGNMVGIGPAWFVCVTIRNGLAPEPVFAGFPVHAMPYPSDEVLAKLAQDLLERCRQQRDAMNQKNLEALKGLDLKGALK